MKKKNAHQTRLAALRAAAQAAVNSGRCPDCGAPLRSNLAITGWWHCSQYGAGRLPRQGGSPLLRLPVLCMRHSFRVPYPGIYDAWREWEVEVTPLREGEVLLERLSPYPASFSLPALEAAWALQDLAAEPPPFLGEVSFLGKGHQGILFLRERGAAFSREVVKVSTVIPYHFEGPRYRSASEALAETRQEAAHYEVLRELRVEGVRAFRYEEREDRGAWKGFLTVPYLEEVTSLEEQDARHLEAMIRDLHLAGFTLTDSIQVGRGRDGRLYWLELGGVREKESLGSRLSHYTLEDNLQSLRHFLARYGIGAAGGAWKKITLL